MNEDDAWQVLHHFAGKAELAITRSMSVRVLRRQLAKAYQPRTANDDDSAMRRINPALDIIEQERDRRELLGIQEETPAEPGPGCTEPWQTDPSETTSIFRQDYTDPNFIKKEVYDRSTRFGDVELYKAWAWKDGRFRKIFSAYANQFALDELGRGLLQWQTHISGGIPCDAIFLTKGNGPATEFRLIIVRIGRGFENVFSYDMVLKGDPYDTKFADVVPSWLNIVRAQLNSDRF